MNTCRSAYCPCFAIMFTMVVVMASCASSDPQIPTTLDDDRPWCGPHDRAAKLTQEWRDPVKGTVEVGNEWRCGLTSVMERYVSVDVADYLASKGIHRGTGSVPFDRWAASDADRAPGERFPKSHTLNVVSIRPLVVVAVPVPSGRALGFGTTLPYHPEPVWFSPELKEGPLPLDTTGDRFKIKVPWGTLVGERGGSGEWRVSAQSS